LMDKVKPGTLFMQVKIRELLYDCTKVLNIPELNP
jgi:hypothetical protein